jgi:hypothetical protein
MNTFLVFTIQIQKLLSKFDMLSQESAKTANNRWNDKIINISDLIYSKDIKFVRLFVITTFIHSSSRMFLKSTLFKIICSPLLVTLPKFNLVESGTKLKE